jgi:proteasome-associated ATPase
VFLGTCEDGTADVFTSGRKMPVSVSPAVDLDTLQPRAGSRAERGAQRRHRPGYETVCEVVMRAKGMNGTGKPDP